MQAIYWLKPDCDNTDHYKIKLPYFSPGTWHCLQYLCMVPIIYSALLLVIVLLSVVTDICIYLGIWSKYDWSRFLIEFAEILAICGNGPTGLHRNPFILSELYTSCNNICLHDNHPEQFSWLDSTWQEWTIAVSWEIFVPLSQG